MARHMEPHFVVALCALAGCYGERPQYPSLRLCAEQEILETDGPDVDSRIFSLEDASVVAAGARRLPSAEADLPDDEDGGLCGRPANRVDVEVATADGRHAWFAISLSMPDGQLEPPEVAPEPRGAVSLDVSTRDDGSFGRASITDETGLVVAARRSASFGQYDVGGLEASVGEALGLPVASDCGSDQYYALKISGERTIEMETDTKKSVALDGEELLVHHVATFKYTKDGSPCSPHGAGRSESTWFALRE